MPQTATPEQNRSGREAQTGLLTLPTLTATAAFHMSLRAEEMLHNAREVRKEIVCACVMRRYEIVSCGREVFGENVRKDVIFTKNYLLRSAKWVTFRHFEAKHFQNIALTLFICSFTRLTTQYDM